MDKNELLIQLSEQGRFWQVDFEELTPAEQVILVVWELESEVNNGGFNQYFFNSSGDNAFAIVDALRTIGAAKVAAIVSSAMQVFPDSVPPRDTEERRAFLDSLAPERTAGLDELDKAFYGSPDNLTELLYSYVERMSADIAGAAEVGIGSGHRANE